MRSFILFFLSSIILSAHPHCFVDVYPAVGKERVTIRWVFDEMSSQMLIMDYDRDHNGKLNEKESEMVYKESFSGLEAFEYYTYFYNKNRKLPTPLSDSFMATIEENKVNFYFTLKLPEGTTAIKFYDEEMFSAYVLKDEFVKKANPTQSYRLKKLDGDFFFGYVLELQ
ncbi:MAG: DUF1007 family protein [Campylobacterota bacterium]|nr:DUF1007 family protein [Campylobacterota bacterium]